jgi:hypothetical protein
MRKDLVRTGQAPDFRRGALGVDLLGVQDRHLKLFVPTHGRVVLIAFVFRFVGDLIVFGQV